MFSIFKPKYQIVKWPGSTYSVMRTSIFGRRSFFSGRHYWQKWGDVLDYCRLTETRARELYEIVVYGPEIVKEDE